MTAKLLAFARFWYDFVVGDDWVVAAGVLVAFTVTAVLAHGGHAAWWTVPAAVVVLLPLSLWRAIRS